MSSPPALTKDQLLNHLAQYDRATIQDKCALSPIGKYDVDGDLRSSVNAWYWWAASLEIGSKYGISEEASQVSIALGLGPMEPMPGSMTVPLVPSALWTAEMPPYDTQCDESPPVILAKHLRTRRPDLAIDVGLCARKISDQTRRVQVAAAAAHLHADAAACYSQMNKHIIESTTSASSGPIAPQPVPVHHKPERGMRKKHANAPPDRSLLAVRYRTRSLATTSSGSQSGHLVDPEIPTVVAHPIELISTDDDTGDQQSVESESPDASWSAQQTTSPVDETYAPELDAAIPAAPDPGAQGKVPVADSPLVVTTQTGGTTPPDTSDQFPIISESSTTKKVVREWSAHAKETLRSYRRDSGAFSAARTREPAEPQPIIDDLAGLAPERWLNDALLDAYGALIARSLGEDKGIKAHSVGSQDPSAYRRFPHSGPAQRFLSQEVEVILHARCSDGHWSAYVVDIRRRIIHLYDAIDAQRASDAGVRKMLKTRGDGDQEWNTIRHSNGPRQPNSWDCGVYAAMSLLVMSTHSSDSIIENWGWNELEGEFLRGLMTLEMARQTIYWQFHDPTYASRS